MLARTCCVQYTIVAHTHTHTNTNTHTQTQTQTHTHIDCPPPPYLEGENFTCVLGALPFLRVCPAEAACGARLSSQITVLSSYVCWQCAGWLSMPKSRTSARVRAVHAGVHSFTHMCVRACVCVCVLVPTL